MGRKAWRIVGVLLVVVSLALWMTVPVSGYTNPHVGDTGFGTTTDACGGCHRAHQGAAATLLKDSTQYALCTSCHDGTGADTKVTSGVYLGTTQGTQDGGLRGGGFEGTYMDTDMNGVFEAGNITSKHTMGTSSLTVWGAGTSGAGETNSTLQCGNCHNPHGNGNYRLLRPRPTSVSYYLSNNAENITIPSGTVDNYTIAYNTSANYTRNFTQATGNWTQAVLNNIGDFCGQCHTRYRAGAGSETSTASGGTTNDNWTTGTAPFEYRHRTEPLTAECLQCHVAHGSSANMTGNAAGPAFPDGTTAPAWQTGLENGKYSRLLYLDNRGVCMQCHTSSGLAAN